MKKYKVNFRTKENVIKDWEIVVIATNGREAKQEAERRWYKNHTDHMFNRGAVALEPEETVRMWEFDCKAEKILRRL